MANFQTVAKASDVAPGTLKLVRGDVVIANVEGEFFAFCSRCPHDKGPLDKGKLAGDVVICPLHFAQFNVRTGEVLPGGVTRDPVAVYQVRLEDGDIQVSKG